MPPRFEQTGRADGKIWIGNECAAEIAGMRMGNVRLGPKGEPVIGADVPLPLYWQQYAHHEDPARNAASGALVTPLDGGPDELLIRCEGTNRPGEIASVWTLRFRGAPDSAAYLIDIHAALEVLPGKRWHVTHNPAHGELDFCSLWPFRTFPPPGRGRKRYTCCFADRGGAVTLIPHNHLESSDKRDILLGRGDRFGWLLEEENPVVEILSGEEASAGLCAYMWDAHIGYRATRGGEDTTLRAGARREASIRITRLGRREGEALMARGRPARAPERVITPVYVHGLNTFRETLDSFPEREQRAWPWAFERGPGETAEGDVDRRRGFDDAASLRIRNARPSTGCWTFTALGSAFGDPPFVAGRRYRLTVMASTSALAGRARAGLRLHREGAPGLGDTAAYEHFWSQDALSGDTPWQRLDVVTPPISPPPDRLHILLAQEGRGTSWFDNLLLEQHA